jgi:hypothetical protein
MSAEQIPLTYERILELFKETDQRMEQRFQDADRRREETERIVQETAKAIGKLGSRIGDIIESMIGGEKIVAQFKALGHDIVTHSRNKSFGDDGTADSGEFDLYLENGDIAIFVEVKTKLKNADVLEHIDRLKKYRKWIETKGGDKRRFIGAVAGAVVERHVTKFALSKGLYVIVQTGVDTEIISPAKFVPKKW